ncbi:MAG: hypothetical protein HRF51_13260 [bacterium]
MHRFIPSFLAITLFSIVADIAVAQSSGSNWQRQAPATELDLELFRALQVANLPTAETLQKGDLEFEISHRFAPALSEGSDYLWGLDGPVQMRLGLGYAFSNRLVVTLARSNADDNIDLSFRYKTLQFHSSTLPLLVGIHGGAAWNTEVYVVGRDKGDSRNFQFYGQLIVNTLINRRLGLGIVPSVVSNSDIYAPSSEHTVTLGTYAEYYISPLLAVLAEWSPVIDGYKKDYNAASFGIELNTGGHFFKIILTNALYLNPSQYLSGSEFQFKSKEWRLGFNITRLLKLKS